MKQIVAQLFKKIRHVNDTIRHLKEDDCVDVDGVVEDAVNQVKDWVDQYPQALCGTVSIIEVNYFTGVKLDLTTSVEDEKELTEYIITTQMTPYHYTSLLQYSSQLLIPFFLYKDPRFKILQQEERYESNEISLDRDILLKEILCTPPIVSGITPFHPDKIEDELQNLLEILTPLHRAMTRTVSDGAITLLNLFAEEIPSVFAENSAMAIRLFLDAIELKNKEIADLIFDVYPEVVFVKSIHEYYYDDADYHYALTYLAQNCSSKDHPMRYLLRKILKLYPNTVSLSDQNHPLPIHYM